MRRSSPLRPGGVLAAALVLVVLGVAAGVAVAAPRSTSSATAYTIQNLVSDGFVPAAATDPNLVNGWGLAAGPATPWWVADNGTDHSTIYSGAGAVNPLVVKVDGGPTGAVFNGGSGFAVTDRKGASGPARFLFATEGGTIRGWSPAVPPPPPSTQTFVGADRSSVDAIYKGLAIATTAHGDRLYAADFHNARVDVFDSSFALVSTPGAFVDPRLPHGYAPFGIQAIGQRVFVTFAKQDADAEDEIAGPGLGLVDAFDLGGRFLGRVAAGGTLDAPWGVALAPAGFGAFSGDLLVGNFGDGRITAYAEGPAGHFSPAGQLQGVNGHPISIEGLWGIGFGNGGPSGPTNSLYFAAGPHDEVHGLFGVITAAG